MATLISRFFYASNYYFNVFCAFYRIFLLFIVFFKNKLLNCRTNYIKYLNKINSFILGYLVFELLYY